VTSIKTSEQPFNQAIVVYNTAKDTPDFYAWILTKLLAFHFSVISLRPIIKAIIKSDHQQSCNLSALGVKLKSWFVRQKPESRGRIFMRNKVFLNRHSFSLVVIK